MPKRIEVGLNQLQLRLAELLLGGATLDEAAVEVGCDCKTARGLLEDGARILGLRTIEELLYDVVRWKWVSLPSRSLPDPKAPLTIRDAQIAELAVSGLSNAQMANYLGIEEGVARDRLWRVLVKYGIRSRWYLTGVLGSAVQSLGGDDVETTTLGRLAELQRTVLRLIARGESDAEAAKILECSDTLIGYCRREIKRVLGVATDHELLCEAERLGLLRGVRRRYPRLTTRQAEVAQGLHEGQSTSEIGIWLNIGPSAVNRHVQILIEKYQVTNFRSLKIVLIASGPASEHLEQPLIPNLSSNELSAVELFAAGWFEDEIARVLGVEPSTARAYLSEAVRKTGLADRSELPWLFYGAMAQAESENAKPAVESLGPLGSFLFLHYSDSGPLGLTPQRLEVLQLVCGGATNLQISRVIFRSVKIVDEEIAWIKRFLGVSTPQEMVREAAARKLIEPRVLGYRPELTQREAEAAELLKRGLSTGEIALQMGILEGGVKTLLTRVRVKFGLPDRRALIVRLVSNDLALVSALSVQNSQPVLGDVSVSLQEEGGEVL